MKKKASYTIEDDVLDNFSRRTKSLSINKSALIENLIKEWISIEDKKEEAINKWLSAEKYEGGKKWMTKN